MKHRARVVAGFFFAVLAGCGGGGGGGGGAVGGQTELQYSGNTNAAIITTSNAGILAANATNPTDGAVANPTDGGAVAGAIVRDSARSESPASKGLLDGTRRLIDRARAIVPNPSPNSHARLAVAVDATNNCKDGGTVRLLGDVSESGTGTLNITFSNCAEGSESLTGNATLRVDAAVFRFDTVILTDFTLSFGRLAVRGEVNLDMGGSIRVQTDMPSKREIVTENVVALFNNSARMTKSENLVVIDTYDDLDNPSSYTETISGRIFDSTHGFVDIFTVSPLAFPSVTQRFPSGGELVLAASGRRILITANSAARATLALDLNGDDFFEVQAVRLAWTDLAGPVAADLGDDDGDGMHNSWETAFGLNAGLAPGLDSDADGFNNSAEYLGGGNPNDGGSIPQLAVRAPLAAASGLIANPTSDPEVPGRSAIASDGFNFLVVSCRDVGPNPGLFGIWMTPAGRVLKDFPIVSTTCPRHRAMAFDGLNHLVVFTSSSGEVRGIRVARSGELQDASPFLIASPGFNAVNHSPAVAFDGTQYLVVWVNSSGIGRIRAARVTPAGAVLGADFPVTGNSVNTGESNPFVAFDGQNDYLVVWTRGALAESQDVFGARVSKAGAVLDPAEIAIATLPNQQRASGVAFDGSNYLVVWDHAVTTFISPPPDGQIFGRRLTRAGALLDGTADSAGIPIATGQFGRPGFTVGNHSSSVTFAGSTFLVTWGVGHFSHSPPAGIYAARISRDGARLDGAPTELGLPVSGTPPTSGRFVHPVVASLRQEALIAYTSESAQEDIFAAPVLAP